MTPADTSLRGKIRHIAATAQREIEFYRAVSRHPETPRRAKILLGAALGYLLSPIDLIPDVIPVIGHLDDAIIVPALIVAAIRLIPESIRTECRAEADSR